MQAVEKQHGARLSFLARVSEDNTNTLWHHWELGVVYLHLTGSRATGLRVYVFLLNVFVLLVPIVRAVSFVACLFILFLRGHRAELACCYIFHLRF